MKDPQVRFLVCLTQPWTQQLGWQPRMSFKALVADMVQSDLKLVTETADHPGNKQFSYQTE
jgi:GDP-D-mannose dehydratase